MIAALLLQIFAPPLPANRSVGTDIPQVDWSCKLVDAGGRVFKISGRTPAFSATDTVKTEKPIVIDSPSDAILAGPQKVTAAYGGDNASFDVLIAKGWQDKQLDMTLFFNSQGTGLATVHTLVPATKLRGYYASGLCQSGFGRY